MLESICDSLFDIMWNGKKETSSIYKTWLPQAELSYSTTILQSFGVERYNRPMPKLRSTKPYSYEERPVPAGSLEVARLRHIILLDEYKSTPTQITIYRKQIHKEKEKHESKEKSPIKDFQCLRTLVNLNNNTTSWNIKSLIFI